MKLTVCQIDQDGLHVEIDYIYSNTYQIPTSYVATIWIMQSESDSVTSRYRLGIKSFGSLRSAETWVLKQLEYSSYLHLANKLYEI